MLVLAAIVTLKDVSKLLLEITLNSITLVKQSCVAVHVLAAIVTVKDVSKLLLDTTLNRYHIGKNWLVSLCLS